MTDPATLARREDRSTSKEAAAAQTPGKIEMIQAAVLTALNTHGPMTDEEILTRLAIMASPSSARTRRAELVRAERVTELRDSQGAVVKRRGLAGLPQTVWRYVQAGEDLSAQPRVETPAERRHREGLEQARKRCAWDVGDAKVADLIIEAYLHPREDAEAMRAEGAR